MKRLLRLSVALTGLAVLLLSLAGGVSVIGGPRAAHAAGMWNLTGSMNTARSSFTLTQFHTGKVLAVGGADAAGNFLSSAELYNPTTGVWTPTGSMSIARFNHTATLLANGKVLVAGGSCSPSNCTALASAELYDLSTGTWSLTGSMHVARENHRATLLSNGEVLVAGGDDGITPSVKALASAEVYNPASGTWSFTGSMHVARFNFSANTLGNGEILAAGGDNGAGDCCTTSSRQKIGGYSSAIPESPCFCPHGITSAELYNPTTGKWIPTGSLNKPRTLFTATSIPDGTFRVLAAGGITCNIRSSSCSVYSSAEVFDPTTGKWTLSGRMHSPRYNEAAAQLNPGTGQVLVEGGSSSSAVLASAEIFTVSTGTWSLTGSMNDARSAQRDIKLTSGLILVAGGGTATAELFTP